MGCVYLALGNEVFLMRIRHSLLFLFFALTFTSCRGGASAADPTLASNAALGTAEPVATGTRSLPTPIVAVTEVPDVKTAAINFLQAWQEDRYDDMYAMLTPVTQDAIAKDAFITRYQDTASNLSLKNIEFQILSTMTKPRVAQVAYQVVFHTTLVGDLTRQMSMNLSLEDGRWLVQWEDGMIMPELRGGNQLALEVKIPARANIYDRNGSALAAQSEVVALGVVPDQVDAKQESQLIEELSRATGKSTGEIEKLIEDNRGSSWYVGIGEAPKQDVEDHYNLLTSFSGMVLNDYTSRYYYDGGLAVHAIGYVLSIPKEDLDAYKRLGYRGDEKIGYSGLEKWGENYLAGTRGASLYVVDSKGQIVTRLGQTDPQSSQAIYTTIDADLQYGVRKAIKGFKGAVVVMERDTGRILAMASSPDYDPNLFDSNNYNSQWGLNDIVNSEDRVLLNRATQGGYPLGSVFKIITMAAGLESGLYTPDSTYVCGDSFTELEGVSIDNWTKAKGYPADGELTLSEALMRSCNPWFNHIGLDLYRQKGNDYLAKMARGFGLGSATGIGQLAEDTGSMPDADSENNAAYLAIGQGTMLVTPLQVVDFIAAVGNGGTLYRPQLVEKIQPPDGDPVYTFTPEVRGTLPVSAENLKAIQEAMRSVVSNKRGTAYRTFTGLNIPIYGKTGTAQNSLEEPHAWFAGYTDTKNSDKPNIAVVVIVENGGEGSEIAAPIFRRVIEYYYDGKPSRLYPWESSFYVTQTPTAEPTETPYGTGPTEETPVP